MKKSFLLLIFCFLSFAVSHFGQEARKLDEWGSINCDDYLGRMDSLASELQNNPSDTVYFLVYEGKQSIYNFRTNKSEMVAPRYGLAKARIRSMKQYLSLKKMPTDGFVFVEAGFREYAEVEIWIVPTGAPAPKPTPTLKKMKYRKGKASGFCLGCC